MTTAQETAQPWGWQQSQNEEQQGEQKPEEHGGHAEHQFGENHE